MFDSSTTRMPQGLTNANIFQTMAAAGTPDPTWAHTFAEDFDRYLASDWTETIGGTGTVALENGLGGRLLLSTSAGATDDIYMQLTKEGFSANSGKDVFFKFAGQLADATACEFMAGLVETTATPLAATDGVYIHKPSGGTTLELVVVVGGVATKAAFPSNLTLANATDFEVGFHIDVQGNVEAFFNPTTGARWPNHLGSGPVGRVASVQGVAMTASLLTVSFGLLNAAAAVKTLAVDFVVASQSR